MREPVCGDPGNDRRDRELDDGQRTGFIAHTELVYNENGDLCMSDTEIQTYQQALVKQLKKANILTKRLIEEAFLNVPRHLFLPNEPLEKVYSDVVIVVKRGEDGQWTSSSSQPAIMAIMLEQLNLKPGQRVLEIGAGTGFNAGLMASIVGPNGKVVTMDIQPDLVEYAREHLDAAGFDWVQTIVGDGGYGCPDEAPYDRIILTVASDIIAPAWKEQLGPDGILVLPFAVLDGNQKSVAFQKRGGELVSVDIKPCGFMPLQGAFAFAKPVQTPLGLDPRLCLFSEPGKELPAGADVIAAWLSQQFQDWASGVAVAVHELINDFFPWVSLQQLQGKPQAGLVGSLAAMGELADQNIYPSLFGFEGERKARYSAVMVESDGIAALISPPGQVAPLIDVMNPGDRYNTTFELYVRNFGPGTNAARRMLEYIQDWDRAGKPSSLQWQIRAIPAEIEYDLNDGEFLVNKPWTNLVISYQ
jgi:protein-L-isoaspartate(D-aspartate) O-methyltransferase